MKIDDNTYTKGDLTVTYQPKKCIHAGNCCKQLSEVFKTSVIPWIDLDGAQNNAIISQVEKCPSGALGYVLKNELVGIK